MSFKYIITIILVSIITACSNLENLFFINEINQGNYFTNEMISKISLGMTQKQIIYILGTPMIKDPFNKKIWLYVLYNQKKNKKIEQKILTLTFDNKNILNQINFN